MIDTFFKGSKFVFLVAKNHVSHYTYTYRRFL